MEAFLFAVTENSISVAENFFRRGSSEFLFNPMIIISSRVNVTSTMTKKNERETTAKYS